MLRAWITYSAYLRNVYDSYTTHSHNLVRIVLYSSIILYQLSYTFFFLNDPAPTDIPPFPLPAPLPIRPPRRLISGPGAAAWVAGQRKLAKGGPKKNPVPPFPLPATPRNNSAARSACCRTPAARPSR